MIKINLARRKMAVQPAASSPSPINSLLNRFNMDQIRELPIRKIGVPIAIAVVTNFFVSTYEDSALAEQDLLIAAAEKEKTVAQANLNRYSAVEAAKKSVEADEVTLRAKLVTLQKLIQGRDLPPKMLLGISHSIPTEVWLKTLTFDRKGISFSGTSLDFTLVSDFMKALGDTAYFEEVQLVSSGKDTDVAVRDAVNFELLAKQREQ